MTIDEAMALFEEADEELGYEHRGYPACVGHLNGVVAVADDTGENGSSLAMYTASDFITWMEAANDAFERDDDDCDNLLEAINETRIQPAVLDGH
jgi:hypothetical protein